MEFDRNALSEDPIVEMEEEKAKIEVGHLEYERPTKKERFLVVSNYSQFASVDVWAGMAGALREKGYAVYPYAIHKIRAILAHDFMLKDILASAVSVRNKFTHVLFVGAAFMPAWVILTIRKMGIRVLYWSLEDPHSLDQNAPFYEMCDMYLSNERKIKELFPKAVYMPPASDRNECCPPAVPLEKLEPIYQDVFRNDVFFGGNIYPNRQKVLEPLVAFLQEKKRTMGIMGITNYMDDREKSPLMKYVIEFADERGRMDGIVDHRYLVMAYGYAKIAINLERDPNYEYDKRFSTNRKYKLSGESLNPRAYEICMCGGALQLIDETRKEIFDDRMLIPGKHLVTFKDQNDLHEKVEYYLTHEEERKAIVDEARKHVLSYHSYNSRATRLIKAIHFLEKDKKALLSDVLENNRNQQKLITPADAIIKP